MGSHRTWVSAVLVLGLAFLLTGTRAEALGLKSLGLNVGMDLSRKASTSYYSDGTQFDTARLVLGSHLDMGSFIIPRLHFVPGADLVVQSNLKIYSINVDARYWFTKSDKVVGYAGAGVGTHFYRYNPSTGLANTTKVGVNIPIGFQRKLSKGLLWFGELKLVIADNEVNSSLRFSVGIGFGSWN